MWFWVGPESGNRGWDGGQRNAPTATVSLRKTTVSTGVGSAGYGRIQIPDRILVPHNILTAPLLLRGYLVRRRRAMGVVGAEERWP